MCTYRDAPPYDLPLPDGGFTNTDVVNLIERAEAMDKVRFRKLDYFWAFDVPSTGATYGAMRNEAGFAGRDWMLFRQESDAIADGNFHFRWVLVTDQLTSRKACVKAAMNSEAFLADLLAESATRGGGFRIVL
jgi:hypothetical protein